MAEDRVDLLAKWWDSLADSQKDRAVADVARGVLSKETWLSLTGSGVHVASDAQWVAEQPKPHTFSVPDDVSRFVSEKAGE